MLVLGASGQVGREVVGELRRRLPSHDVIPAARSSTDPDLRIELERPETIERMVSSVRPSHVVLTAAATNVGWCEEHPDESRTLNVLGTRAVAEAARRAAVPMTFLSTDYVFDGTSGPNGESDPTRPINVYGADKLAAESEVLESSDRNLVIRTCQVFGMDARRVNFVVRIVDALRRGERFEVAGDLFGTPTFAPDLARGLVELTFSGETGIWHLAGDTFLSRHELAVRSAAAFGCRRGSIVEVVAAQMNDPVNRPRRAGLRNDRLEASGYRFITPLNEALATLARAEGTR